MISKMLLGRWGVPSGLMTSTRKGSSMNEAEVLLWLMLIFYAALCAGAIFLIVIVLFIIGGALFDFGMFVKEKIEDYINYLRDVFKL